MPQKMVVDKKGKEFNMSEETTRNAGTDLIRVHKAISRAIGVSKQHSQAPGPEPAHRDGFQSYARALRIFLNAHHTGEDEVAFPFIEKKAPDLTFEQLRDDHLRIVEVLKEIEAWVSLGEAGWESEALEEYSHCIQRLEKLWFEHIDREEEVIGPEALERLLTADENIQLGQQIGAHAAQLATPNELVFPFFFYNLSPSDRAIMAQGLLPVIMEQLVPYAWKPVWAPMQPYLLA